MSATTNAPSAQANPDQTEASAGQDVDGAGQAASSGDQAAAGANRSSLAPPSAPAPARGSRRGGRRRKRFSVLRFLLLLFLLGVPAGAGILYWAYTEFNQDLPERLDVFVHYDPARASRVFARGGQVIGEFFLQRRILVPLSRVPRHVIHAFVAGEDHRFFEHRGVDPLRIVRAAYENYRARAAVQGGSTITQQVARMILLSSEKTVERKLREMVLAFRIERELSKQQILTIYLNQIYLGHGAYGVQAAAENYFGKDVEHLTVAEAAMLAGLPKAPSRDSPFVHFERARRRQSYVLERMVEDQYLTEEEAAAARKEPIAVISREAPLNYVAAPYFVEHVRKYVMARYGDREVLDSGLRIYTTLDMPSQLAAEAAVRDGLEEFDRRCRFRGPIGHLADEERPPFLAAPPQVLENGVLSPVPPAASATAGTTAPPTTAPAKAIPAAESTAPAAGPPRALLPERTYLAMVQSIGKPSVEVRLGEFAAPLAPDDAGRLLRFSGPRGARIRVGDLVPVRVRRLKQTLGSGRKARIVEKVVVVLAQRPIAEAGMAAIDLDSGAVRAMVGGYDYRLSQFNRATQAHRQAGSSIKPYIYAAAVIKGYTELSIVYDAPVAFRTAAGVWAPSNYKAEFLGPVTLRTALAKSLNTVAARLVGEMGVDFVIDVMRKVGLTSKIPRHISIALGTPEPTVLEAASAIATFPSGGRQLNVHFIDRILEANGRRLEESPSGKGEERIPADVAYVVVDLMKAVVLSGTGKKAQELGRPAAGKTGTSNDFRDAWFIGYTADLLAAVWVGRDDFKSLGNDVTGGKVALPIWLQFMKTAHPPTPARDFPVPPGIVFARARPGLGVAARPGAPGSILIPFRRGTLPPAFVAGTERPTFGEISF